MSSTTTAPAPPIASPAPASTDLARADRVPAVITTADDFRTSLRTWQQHQFHILTPIADFRALPAQFGLMPAQVRINPDVTAGEVYQDRLFCKEGEVALTKLALSKIAAVAGMSIDTYRTDPRTIPNLWEVKATARFIGIDGTLQALAATEELDLRDGTARAERVMGSNRSTAALQAVRAKGLRNCETRAINAAVRAFGIKQKYTIAELQKPFVVLRVVFQPDLSDPEVRRMVAARALQGSAVSAPTLPAADQAITDDEPAAETAGPNEPTEVVAEVPSDTLHGVTYTITRFARSGHLACTCRAFTFSRSQPPTCKHIDRYRRDAE